VLHRPKLRFDDDADAPVRAVARLGSDRDVHILVKGGQKGLSQDREPLDRDNQRTGR
jgi:hypothetical protein